jgi:hypothetical protein
MGGMAAIIVAIGTHRITEAELARGTSAIPDEGFMKDVEEGIAERGQPWNPPNWG